MEDFRRVTFRFESRDELYAARHKSWHPPSHDCNAKRRCINKHRQGTKQTRRVETSRIWMCQGCGSEGSRKENDEAREHAKKEALDGETAKSAERIICSESADAFQLRDFVCHLLPRTTICAHHIGLTDRQPADELHVRSDEH